MPDRQPYSERLRVLTHDLDAWDRLRTSALLRYLEQAAWDASAAAGFGDAWYAERQTAWVIRRMTLHRLGPALYGKELTVTTWVGGWSRIRALREYEVRHPDGSPVALDRIYLPERTKRTQVFEGNPKEAAAKLVEKLRFEARVI